MIIILKLSLNINFTNDKSGFFLGQPLCYFITCKQGVVSEKQLETIQISVEKGVRINISQGLLFLHNRIDFLMTPKSPVFRTINYQECKHEIQHPSK
jgi:hypothetical protein